MPSVTRARVAEAVRRLKYLHQVGLKSLEQRDGRGGYGERRAEVEARRLSKAGAAGPKIGGAILRKLRQFADGEAGYSAADLKELCRLCEQHRRPWGVRHVTVIVRVPKSGGQRSEVQRRAIEGGWTTSRLEAEVRRRFGRRRAGGRKPAVLPDIEVLLSQIEGMCESWRRLYAELATEAGPQATHPHLRDLPQVVRQRLGDATEAIRQLQSSLNRQIERRRSTSTPSGRKR